MATSNSGAPTEVVLVRSRLLAALGVPHCFTTRVGGFSTGVFSTLNFGNPGELPAGDTRRDPPETIARNIALVLDEIGAQGREVVQVHQVHGAAVHVVRAGELTHRTSDASTTKADAIVTDDSARIACVRVADCAPVLMAGCNRVGRVVAVAAVHAGWRGCVGGVVERAADALGALGAERLVAAVGPCIGPDAFEVGPEVAEAFWARFGRDSQLVRARASVGGVEKFDVDLAGALRRQLLACGVEHKAIDMLAECTCSNSERFFSHRRDRGMTGRMAGFIGMVSRDASATAAASYPLA